MFFHATLWLMTFCNYQPTNHQPPTPSIQRSPSSSSPRFNVLPGLHSTIPPPPLPTHARAFPHPKPARLRTFRDAGPADPFPGAEVMHALTCVRIVLVVIVRAGG
ncbi:hypothetical protein EX30DRAFT_56842 [Ascodesmis nigricans]|uniref:Uncharacterized protein n=1 Tax=Ascodesmis nigricans TaxID=341454 RepID=A0A4S2MUQ0_9PEZI|nr:hypothetical protein EX30DRAFT_56842 [Ascodesmis nigricans]